MKNLINKIINKIRIKIVRFLLGDQYVKCIIKINENSEQIDFLSSIVGEQSKIIGSLALVQSDMAHSMSQMTNINSDSDDKDCFIIKIPTANDEFLN